VPFYGQAAAKKEELAMNKTQRSEQKRKFAAVPQTTRPKFTAYTIQRHAPAVRQGKESSAALP